MKTDKVLVCDKTGWTSYSDENVSAVSKRTFSSGFHQVISTNWNIIACLIFFVQRNFVIAMYIKDSHSRVLIVVKLVTSLTQLKRIDQINRTKIKSQESREREREEEEEEEAKGKQNSTLI